jgi:hypothetical protein
MALVLPDMPEVLHRNLMNSIKLAFDGYVVNADSEREAELYKFIALHFSWYNRYGAQVSPFHPLT